MTFSAALAPPLLAVLASLAPSPSARGPTGELRGGPLAPVMVEEGVLFRFRDPDAHRVSVVGDFNDWDLFATPLTRGSDGLWRVVVDLPEGNWAYFFVVDGRWVRDPDNPVVQPVAREIPAGTEEGSLLMIRDGEILRPKPPGFREGRFYLSASYDRVNQVTLRSELRYENRAELHPVLGFGAAYALGRHRWLYDVAVTQPLFRRKLLDVGLRAYRVVDTPDRHRIGDTENSLAAFFLRQDWRDYHEAEGLGAHATLHLGSAVRLTGRWRSEEHRALAKTTDWGLFGGDRRMRPNPPADEGELHAVRFEYRLDTRNSRRNPSRGFLATALYESAGGRFGGDFEFRRTEGELRRYLKLSRGHYFDVRLAAGRIDRARRGGPTGPLTGLGAIPAQERYYLGGVGTMRATQFKSITGDRMLLANAEIRVEVFRGFQAVVFTDVGDAWEDAAADLDLKADAGVGFQDSDSAFRLNLAKKVDGRGGDEVFLSARIQRMF